MLYGFIMAKGVQNTSVETMEIDVHYHYALALLKIVLTSSHLM